MALPLDLAMEVWDPWPKAVGLTGIIFRLSRVRAASCSTGLVARVLSLFGLSGSPANKLALIK